jgi:hypothetical protein
MLAFLQEIVLCYEKHISGFLNIIIMGEFPLRGIISLISVETLVLALQSVLITKRLGDTLDKKAKTNFVLDIISLIVSLSAIFCIDRLKSRGRKRFLVQGSYIMVS